MVRRRGRRSLAFVSPISTAPHSLFATVLVGIDGRQGGRDAVALARTLAGAEAEITLAHVYSAPTAGGRASALALPSALDSAQRLLAHAAGQAGRPVQTALVSEPSAGRGLQELAEHRRPDLLVVGSCHRGLLGRVLLGDDTRRVLAGARCPVAIAPADYAVRAVGDRRLRRIGVGCDVSAESADALRFALDLAARHGASVSAMSVLPIQSIPYGGVVPDQWPGVAERLVEEHGLDPAELEGIDAEVAYGDAAEELGAFSATVDVLVLGARASGFVARFLGGGTSNRVAHRSACPLIVLPRRG